MSISLDESLNHVSLGLKAGLPGSVGLKAGLPVGIVPTWFAEMDYNRDGLISPTEFDRNLNEDVVWEVSSQQIND